MEPLCPVTVWDTGVPLPAPCPGRATRETLTGEMGVLGAMSPARVPGHYSYQTSFWLPSGS